MFGDPVNAQGPPYPKFHSGPATASGLLARPSADGDRPRTLQRSGVLRAIFGPPRATAQSTVDLRIPAQVRKEPGPSEHAANRLVQDRVRCFAARSYRYRLQAFDEG